MLGSSHYSTILHHAPPPLMGSHVIEVSSPLQLSAEFLCFFLLIQINQCLKLEFHGILIGLKARGFQKIVPQFFVYLYIGSHALTRNV
jgi:hypothetical protein